MINETSSNEPTKFMDPSAQEFVHIMKKRYLRTITRTVL